MKFSNKHDITMRFPISMHRTEMELTGGPNGIRKAQEDIKMIMRYGEKSSMRIVSDGVVGRVKGAKGIKSFTEAVV